MLWLNMVVFTVIEGIVGLFIMFGLFTRLMSIGVFFLAMGILLIGLFVAAVLLRLRHGADEPPTPAA